jgi:riboflavin biosynthesis pyrimidine reductase
LTAGVRQIYPAEAALTDTGIAARYACPDRAEGAAPWVRANMVQSLDGAATLEGRSGGLSSDWDQQVFAMLRAITDVILVGAGTARTEDYGPVRPQTEGLRWAWLREGRTPSPPIAVVSRHLDLDLGSALVAESPDYARTIIITTESAPPRRRAAAARTADVLVAGEASVDIAVALDLLAGRGHRCVLAEGGPHMLGQIAAEGRLDELCLTVSPLLAGPGAERITQGMQLPGGDAALPCTLAHVLADEGYLFCRYLVAQDAGQGPSAEDVSQVEADRLL